MKHSCFLKGVLGVIIIAALPSLHAAEPALPDATAAKPAAVEQAVVKIFATMRYPDPIRPWNKQAPRDVTGTGVIIEGRRILTNAHLALYASQVQVQAHQSGDKLAATVEYVAPGIDLAVLKLEDESFFETHAPLIRAQRMPAIKDTVMVYGYPTGGTSLSITKGIVSRIEFAGYNHPVSGLRIQIDAAINPGNSGGPALAGDEMIGLAYSRLGGADNIGYIIPCEEIELFLQDIADGRHDGKPAMHDLLQTFENPALRAFLKPGQSVDGIIVNQPDSADPDYPLKVWDIITRIGDAAIDNEGMIKLGDNLRVRFQYRIQHEAREGLVPLTVVRAGQELAVQLPVKSERAMLIPDLAGEYPPYFILGPVTFSAATAQFVGPLGGNAKAMQALSVVGSPLVTRRGDKAAFAGEQLVIISSPFFPHKLAKGYDNPVTRVIETVNDIPVRNLGHLVAILRDSKDEFLTFLMTGRRAEALVFPRQEMIEATEEILSDNGVRAQGSPDLMEVWSSRPAK